MTQARLDGGAAAPEKDEIGQRILKGILPFAVLFFVLLTCALMFDSTSEALIEPVYRWFLTVGAVLCCVVVYFLERSGEADKRRREGMNLAAGLVAAGIFAACILTLDSAASKVTRLTMGALLALVWLAGYLAVTRQMTAHRAVLLLFAAGFVLRLGYILYTDIDVRQHDVNSFGSGVGHAGYIEYLLNNKHLPDFDPTSVWQFYHPPLHHALAALWLDIMTKAGMAWQRALESIQFLTAFYSCCCLVISYRIFRFMNLKGAGLVCATALMAFSPTFLIFSGSINNDVLSVTFLLAALLAALKWSRSGSWAHILQIAVFIGLGMSTKMSVGILAPAIAAMFLWKLIQKGSRKGRLIAQYAVFGVVCIPLGLWWNVRNALLYGSPLSYVPMLAEDSYMYVGNYSLFERFFIPLKDAWSSEFMLWGPVYEYNAWAGLLKTSVFGEYILTNFNPAVNGFSDVLVLVNLALALFAAALLIRYTFSKRSPFDLSQRLLVSGNYLAILLSYLAFCYKFAHTCTMNIRYASPLILLSALVLGLAIGASPRKQEKVGAKVLSWTAIGLTGVFCVFSSAVYVLLGTAV